MTVSARRKVTETNIMRFVEGDWAYSKEHREVVRVVEARNLWDHVGYRVFLPGREATGPSSS